MTGILIEKGNPWTPEVAGKLTKTTVNGGGPTFALFLLELVHGAGPAAATQAELKTHIEELTVKIVRRQRVAGGGVREETITLYDKISATDLLNHYAFHNLPLVDGYLPIYFVQPNFSAKGSGLVAKHFDLGTADVKEIHVEVKLSAAVTNPSMTLLKGVRNVKPKPMGQVIGLVKEPQPSVGAAQEIVIDNLKVKDGTLLRGVHLDTDVIDEIRFKVNGNLRHTYFPGAQDYLHEILALETGGKNPQAGMTHIDFMVNDYGALWDLNGVNRFDIEIDFNAGTGGGWNVWMEKIMGPMVAPGQW